jgi:hypothetical protein
MTVDFEVLEDPENPPNEIRELPLPDVLLPCATGCYPPGGPLSKSKLVVKGLDTPPGDDTLTFKGELFVTHPLAPWFYPVFLGVVVVIEDAVGARVLGVTVPGGAHDPVTKVGWQVARSGTSWKYVDKSATPPGGITRVTVKDASKKQPGLLKVKVVGKRGAYPVDTASLPLTGLLIMDPPLGQCGVATFVEPEQACTTDGKGVKCR